MSFAQILTESVNFVHDNPCDMKLHARIVRETRYARKLPFEPFPNFSTVYSEYYCRLARNWEIWTDETPQPVKNFAQIANLIHEAHHSIQRSQMGNISFNNAWLFQRAGRFRLEKDAYGAQAKYFMKFFGTSLSQTMPYLMSLARLLSKHYFLGDAYNVDRCLDEIIKASQ